MNIRNNPAVFATLADYKEKVNDLLARVATVSVETQRILEEMKTAPR
jgi:uncharacterized protein YeeX (DUF496 family)